MSRTPIALVSVLVVMSFAGSIAGCGSASSDGVARADDSALPADAPDASAPAPDASSPDGGAVVQVLVKSMSFDPKEITVHPGDTVRWVWDRGRHNVVSGTAAGDTGVPDGKFCSPGGASCNAAPLHGPPFSFDLVVNDVGDFPYFCTPHVSMGMVGTIHVVP